MNNAPHSHTLSALCFVLCLLLPACSLSGDDDEQVRIRIRNESDAPFSRVFVGFPEDDVAYGSLAAGESSAYETVSSAYRYAYVEVDAGGEEYKVQPIDYVGETLLDGGRYTYALDLSTERLSLRLVED